MRRKVDEKSSRGGKFYKKQFTKSFVCGIISMLAVYGHAYERAEAFTKTFQGFCRGFGQGFSERRWIDGRRKKEKKFIFIGDTL